MRHAPSSMPKIHAPTPPQHIAAQVAAHDVLSSGCVSNLHTGGPLCLALLAHCALDLIQDRLVGKESAQCTVQVRRYVSLFITVVEPSRLQNGSEE